MPKFDVVIMNPPYGSGGQSLYLNIIDKVFHLSDKIIAICPIQWTESFRNNKRWTKYKTLFGYYLKSAEYIDNLFEGADICGKLGIYYFDKTNKNDNIDLIESLKWQKFKKPELTKRIYDKFQEYININGHMATYEKIDNGYPYYLSFPAIRGDKTGKSYLWTTLCSKKNYESLEKNEKAFFWYNFEHKYQLNNFIKYIENDIFMFSLYIVKTDLNNNYNIYLPWIGDCEKEYTDEDLCKKFNITEEEYNYIKDEMKDFGWEIILNTMKE